MATPTAWAPGKVYVDPWSADLPAQCVVTEAMKNTTKGVLQKCHDLSTSTNCYEEVGNGHVIHHEYDSCTSSWILLPGFNLLPNWFLIGAFIGELAGAMRRAQRSPSRLPRFSPITESGSSRGNNNAHQSRTDPEERARRGTRG